MRALTVPGYAWGSHPAVLMWRGYEEALGRYGLVMCRAWTARGFGDTCADTIRADLAAVGIETIRTYPELAATGALPPWLFEVDLQRSHRSALVGKDPDRYRPLFPDVPDDLPYLWPVRSPEVLERERRREELAEQRRRRAEERQTLELARARRRRSRAAKRGWKTRAANLRDARLEPPPAP